MLEKIVARCLDFRLRAERDSFPRHAHEFALFGLGGFGVYENLATSEAFTANWVGFIQICVRVVLVSKNIDRGHDVAPISPPMIG